MSLSGEMALVTGADGFIGSHLVETLLENRVRVRALSCYNSFNHHGWLEELDAPGELEIVSGDLRDPFFCEELAAGCSAVFHLGALIAIPYSYKASQSYIDTNVSGTHNLLRAALRSKPGVFVQISSSEVYGSARYLPIDEKHPLRPQSPYAASKVASDALAFSFHCSFDLPVVIARPFNNFGPRQSARAVIPTILAALASGKGELALGSLEPQRDFIYVRDNCRALLSLAETPAAIGETVNIGTGAMVSIAQLLQAVREVTGLEFTAKKSAERLRPARSEVQALQAECARLRELTGFRPAITLREGLRKTWDWIRRPENLRHYKPEIYNQ